MTLVARLKVTLSDVEPQVLRGGVRKSCWLALCSDASVRYAEPFEARGDPPCPASTRPSSAACLPG